MDSDANSIKYIKFDTGHYIDLEDITVTYENHFGYDLPFIDYTLEYGSVDENFTTLQNQINEAESKIVEQSNFWNNAYVDNLSNQSYEEAIRDQLQNEYYNGGDILSFKRERGTFGGHYHVHKVTSASTINGAPEVLEFKEVNLCWESLSDYKSTAQHEVIYQYILFFGIQY